MRRREDNEPNHTINFASVRSLRGEIKKKNGWKIHSSVHANNNNNNNTTTTTKATTTNKSNKNNNVHTKFKSKSVEKLLNVRERYAESPRRRSNKRRKLSSAKEDYQKSIFQNSSSDDNATCIFPSFSPRYRIKTSCESEQIKMLEALRYESRIQQVERYVIVHEHQDEENTSWKSRSFSFTQVTKYDWNPKSLDELLREHPNPDADVRFFDSSKNKPPIISQFSLLLSPR